MPILRDWFAQVERAGLLDGVGSPLLRPAGVKILVDGSIQAYTAALSGGYHGRPEIRPGILGNREDLDAFVFEMHAAGHQVVAHGNGDEAIEAILAAVERAQAACPRPDPRHLLIHCQTATDAQLARMEKRRLWPSFSACMSGTGATAIEMSFSGRSAPRALIPAAVPRDWASRFHCTPTRRYCRR